MEALRRLTALLVRSLQSDVRRVLGHFIRGFAAAGMLLTTTFVLLNAFALGAPGLRVFRWVMWCDALLISAAAVVFFAPVIGSEREAGSLSLLRMTGTSPLTLVVGHSLGGIVIGCLLVAVQMPFTVLTITLGGVLWHQVMAGFLALLAHLILCAGVGLFLSVLCKRGGTAALYTLLVILGLWVGPMLVRRGTAGLADQQRISTAVQREIDGVTRTIDDRLVWQRLEEISSGSTDVVAPQFSWGIGGGLFLLIAAAAMLDWRPLEVSAYSPIVIQLWRSSGQRAWRWLPIAGKDYRQFMGGFKGAIVRCIVYPALPVALLAAMKRYGEPRMTNQDILEGTFWIAGLFVIIEVWAIAARWIRNEVVEQTWSTLVLTPHRTVSILAQKAAAAVIGILPGIAVCVAVGMFSPEVQKFWRELGDGLPRNDGVRLLLIQTVTCTAVCGAGSLLMPSVPPTVCMFVAFLATLVQFVILGVTIDSLRLHSGHRAFWLCAYATIVICGAAAIVCERRIRKLTERD